MKVQVKQSVSDHFIGFFDHARRRPGDVFTIPDEPRRELFRKEKSDVESNAEARAVYEKIKDKEGKVPSQFSFKWMEPVASAEQDRVSTAQQAMDRRSADIKAEKAGQRALDGPATSKDVI